MLFALSSDSISCSKLSKATSFSSRECVGDWIWAMDSFIRSASDGPPKRALSAPVSMGRKGCEVLFVVGAEASAGVLFSMDHFRRFVRFGSCAMVGG